MGLFTPAYLSKDPKKREEGFKKLTNDKKLREVLGNQSHPVEVRVQAYRRMQELKLAPRFSSVDAKLRLALLPGYSEKELADIILSENDKNVRNTAVSKLRSPEIITKLCLSMKNHDLDQPLAYLSEEQLSMVVKKGGNNTTRENARRRIKTPGVLEKLLLALSPGNTFEAELITRSVAGVENEEVLKEIFFLAQTTSLKNAIVSRMRSPDTVIEVILFCDKTGDYSESIMQLLKKLTELEHFLRIVEAAQKDATVEGAIAYIRDEEALYQLASAHASEKIRLAAFQSLCNQKAKAQLEKLAEFATDKGMREAAVRKISSQKVLRELYGRETDEDIKVAILSVLQKNVNGDLFEALALSDPSVRIRLSAAKRVANPAILQKVMETERDEAVLQAAILGIDDESTLMTLLQTTNTYSLRMTIISRLTDRTTLLALAEGTTDPCIHELIISRLKTSADRREVMNLISEIEAGRDEVGLSGANFYSRARRLAFDKQLAAAR